MCDKEVRSRQGSSNQKRLLLRVVQMSTTTATFSPNLQHQSPPRPYILYFTETITTPQLHSFENLGNSPIGKLIDDTINEPIRNKYHLEYICIARMAQPCG